LSDNDWAGPFLGHNALGRVGLYHATKGGRVTKPPSASRRIRVTIPPATPRNGLGVTLTEARRTRPLVTAGPPFRSVFAWEAFPAVNGATVRQPSP
jgi:hypothetical protein